MAIYGECESQGLRVTVRISDLDDTGCDLACDAGEFLVDGDLSLWIGAIGPLKATAVHVDANHLAAQFKEPLDERILEHFALD